MPTLNSSMNWKNTTPHDTTGGQLDAGIMPALPVFLPMFQTAQSFRPLPTDAKHTHPWPREVLLHQEPTCWGQLLFSSLFQNYPPKKLWEAFCSTRNFHLQPSKMNLTNRSWPPS